MATRVNRVDVWWCGKCGAEWSVPSIPHKPHCPQCGERGWWRRFLNADAPPPVDAEQLELEHLEQRASAAIAAERELQADAFRSRFRGSGR